jgi:hypothetical protein
MKNVQSQRLNRSLHISVSERRRTMTEQTPLVGMIPLAGVITPIADPETLSLEERFKHSKVMIANGSIVVTNRDTHAQGLRIYAEIPAALKECKSITAGELLAWYRQKESQTTNPFTLVAIGASITCLCKLFIETEISHITAEERGHIQQYKKCYAHWSDVECLGVHLSLVA